MGVFKEMSQSNAVKCTSCKEIENQVSEFFNIFQKMTETWFFVSCENCVSSEVRVK